MKIIQSFALFKEGSPYTKNNKVSLNFYSFLLSYLTLNKYYGHVTMVCNQTAYDAFIKYIPYDEIILMENKNDFMFWNLYKVDAMKIINDEFIHVDSDVFIFDDLFREYIDGDYDIIVQDITPANVNVVTQDFVKDNAEFLSKNDIIDISEYDGRFTSCGTIGMKKHVQPMYFLAVDKLYRGVLNNELLNTDPTHALHSFRPSIITEELTLYFVAIRNKYRIFDILSENSIGEHGHDISANIHKYTHMWFDTRFVDKNLTLMRNKIRTEFPYYRKLVDKYELEVMQNQLW